MADSRRLLPLIAARSIEVVFVDGGHEFETARRDIREALRIAQRFVIIHDTDNPRTVVRAAMLQELNEEWRIAREFPHSKAPWGLTVLERVETTAASQA